MKAIAIVIAILAILIAVVPYTNNCSYQGSMLALANGKQVPMKCYWAAQSEIAMAVPLLGLAIALAFSRRKETRRALVALGVLLAVSVILLPTCLIGVCAHPQAACNLVAKPALIFMGLLVIAVNLVGLAISERKPE